MGAQIMNLSASVVLVAAFVGSCGAPPSDRIAGQVDLATRATDDLGPGKSCPAALLEGLLVPDATTGTAVQRGTDLMRVIWPFGYRARVLGGDVEVLDRTGVVVAKTGRNVALGGGMITADERWTTCGPPLRPQEDALSPGPG